jgi:hypothetical protein
VRLFSARKILFGEALGFDVLGYWFATKLLAGVRTRGRLETCSAHRPFYPFKVQKAVSET